MARPRVFVNRQGKPVKEHTGVSCNKARRHSHVIRSSGERQEFRTWAEARAVHAAGPADSIPAGELARMAALARYRRDLAHQVIMADDRYRELRELTMIDGPIVARANSDAELVVGLSRAANALADDLGVPRLRIDEDRQAVSTGPRLLDVIRVWKQHKKEGKQLTQHRCAIKRYWREFVDQVDNLFVAQFSPGHFRRLHSCVVRGSPTMRAIVNARRGKTADPCTQRVCQSIGRLRRRLAEFIERLGEKSAVDLGDAGQTMEKLAATFDGTSLGCAATTNEFERQIRGARDLIEQRLSAARLGHQGPMRPKSLTTGFQRTPSYTPNGCALFLALQRKVLNRYGA